MHRSLFSCGAPALLACTVLGACKSIGPGSVERDRFDYNTAIANSWKDQTLLNIVKIRYADMPLFVEVASVVAGYTLESQVSVAGSFPETTTFGGDTFSAGASGKFTDRPTITYAPITGQQFNQSFMTPIPPEAVLFLIQTGWAPELILPMIVDGMNGLRSEIAAGSGQRRGDSAYYRAVELFGRIQRSGALSMQIVSDGQDRRTELIMHAGDLPPESQSDLSELAGLLGIAPGSTTLSVSYGAVQRDERDLAILTRSMLQIMIQMATVVDVPEEHVESGRTVPTLEREDEADTSRIIAILSSKQRPEDAFVAVPYKDHWFWIDDRDFASKRTFAFLMILFSLTETGGREGLPVVTIPSG
jgi:hypothetical protein